MSSTAAVIGLTYRDTDVQVLDGIFLQIVRGLFEPADIRGMDLVVPSSGGQVVRNRQAHRRVIGLRGWIRGVSAGNELTDRAAFAVNRAVFETLFDPTLDPGALVATLEDGSSRTIDARTLNAIPDPVVPTFQWVDVELESVDPNWAVVVP